jgi:hypothetical protein
MGSCVGIDLHRQRSVVVVLNEDGERVTWSRIDNTAENLTAEIVSAGGARIWTVPHRSENPRFVDLSMSRNRWRLRPTDENTSRMKGSPS